jgi:hypothetical protein
MNTELEQALSDWADIRNNSKAFIHELGDMGLKKKFPRPGLDTYGKHFEEMIDVQKAYMEAIKSGAMAFDGIAENDEYKGNTSSQMLLDSMDALDAELKTIVENSSDKRVVWAEDDEKTLISQLRNLCIHESMHIGQLVAFSYVAGVKIPDSVIESWALSTQ